MSDAWLVVVTERRDLPAEAPGLWIEEADRYLAGDPALSQDGLRVVNLCRTQRYLSRGYYVSLLADARGQIVLPTVESLEGLQHPHAMFRALRESGVDVLEGPEMSARLRLLPDGEAPGGEAVPVVRDEDEDGEPRFRRARPDEVVRVLVCVGRCEVPGLQRLASRVYRAWPSPLLRLRLLREDDRWRLFDLVPEKVTGLDETERQTLVRALANPKLPDEDREDRRKPSLAVLYDERDPYKASSPETLDRLERIAGRRGLRLERIGLGDLARLGEHDALFIRTVTGIEEPAFRFAVRAEALGMPVIDDPRSIIRCSNKIFLHELLGREGVPMPPSVVIDRETRFATLLERLGLPLVLKVPDGSFSGGVFKVSSARDYQERTSELFKRGPLLIAQAFVPTAYDWRITVLDGRPLFVCRYHMAPGHWQIRQVTARGARYGRVDAVPRDQAPEPILRLACRAAKLLGDGLYGVDLKETATGQLYIIEINDNPNLDTGYDDEADGDAVFEDLITWFERRLPKEKPDVKPRPRPRESSDLAPLRKPVGRLPRRAPGRPYRAFEVMGLELEYVLVDRDLNAISAVEELLAALAGRPTSDVDLGLVGFSNEIFDHVVEVKNAVPLARLDRIEESLVEGVRRLGQAAAARLGARLLPGGMHPWFDPKNGRMWSRSNRRIYDTYARLFDVHSHGWANVQASHVNLPVGRDDEAVAMMNAAAMLVPYLPALAAASPMFDGELQPAVDNRLAWIIEHQARLPESSGAIVPEPIDSLTSYRRDILGRMYQAVDRFPDTEAIRHEFLNARGAVFKFSRESMEVRVLDVQECVHADVAVAWFTRQALRSLAAELLRSRIVVPPHAVLVEDFRAVVKHGSAARVSAPHLAPAAARDADGRVAVRDVLRVLLERASIRLRREEEPYRAFVDRLITHGNLSEAVARALAPYTHDDDNFTQHARVVWRQLSECLLENRPWGGRWL